MTIKILPARLANQIAAGEVVERPASVVKELLENSIDAGATKIEVDIVKGGHKRILIRDNGKGVLKAELELALSRHATSKIASLDDLENIASLGFRGEALASISSVSRLCFTSKPSAQAEAWQAQCEGRDMAVVLSPVAHPNGTCVQVQDLFFNTPARRKFLRTEKTEFAHIDDVFKRAVLGHFGVQFSLRHNDKLVRSFAAAVSETAKYNRVAQICGAKFKHTAIAFASQYQDIRCSGWVGGAGSERAQTDQQYVYINGRMMRDKLVARAIRQAYVDVIPPTSYPAYAVYLTMPASALDVNVHPTKQEVRFHQARLVHDFILRTITDALQRGFAGAVGAEQRPAGGRFAEGDTVAAGSLPSATAPGVVREGDSEAVSEGQLPAAGGEVPRHTATAGDAQETPLTYTELGADNIHHYAQPNRPHYPAPKPSPNGIQAARTAASARPSAAAVAGYNRLLQTAAAEPAPPQHSSTANAESSAKLGQPPAESVAGDAAPNLIGQCLQLRDGNILARLGEALYWIDQRAVVTAMLSAQWKTNPPVQQPLLLPVAVASKDLHCAAADQLRGCDSQTAPSDAVIAALTQVAIDLVFTGKKWILRQVPAGHRQMNWSDLLPKILAAEDLLNNPVETVAQLVIAAQLQMGLTAPEHSPEGILHWLVQCLQRKTDSSHLLRKIDEDKFLENVIG